MNNEWDTIFSIVTFLQWYCISSVNFFLPILQVPGEQTEQSINTTAGGVGWINELFMMKEDTNT